MAKRVKSHQARPPPVSKKRAEDRFSDLEPVNPRMYFGSGQQVMRPADAGMKPPTKKGR
jgi:hypothetical protein